MTRLIITLCISLFPLFASAQRIIGDLEANSDERMTPSLSNDSLTRGGGDGKDVPVDVKAWFIDPLYGNRTDTFVDTLQHQFHGSNLPEGVNGHFAPLGNLGSPRQNRIFMERREDENFIFLNPFDQFYTPTERFRFYNTKSPYLNATYNACGSKTTGDDHIKVTYTNNVDKRTNIGGLFDYIYGQGYYNSQSTGFMGASAWASHIGDRYDFHFYYTHNYMKMKENGGITDETYITHPELMPRRYSTSDLPTWLNNVQMRQEHHIVHFNHHYNIGFTRTEGDSTNLRDVFVPVTSIFHTLDIKSLRRNYFDRNTSTTYHERSFMPSDTTDDDTRNFYIRNTVGISLREGFNRWAAAGLTAYVAFEHQTYELPDSFLTSFGHMARYGKSKATETNTMIGGQIIRTQGQTLHYNADAEFVLTGARSGDVSLKGRGELNLPVLGDTAQLVVNAFIKRQTPSYYLRHFHAKSAWWDVDLDREIRTRIEGQLTIPHTKTRLSVGVENLKNYTYLQTFGNPYKSHDGVETYSHEIRPLQCSDNVQVVSANLRQDIKLGILHIDNDVTYQTTTRKDVLPLPTLTLYHNIYISFKIAKVLACELGGDLKYFTEYNAPDYSPVLTQFVVQNKDNRVKIGNYPLVSVYTNLDLKRTRFYLQFYHVNQGAGRYFWAPGYPANPYGMHMGISWNFYD